MPKWHQCPWNAIAPTLGVQTRKTPQSPHHIFGLLGNSGSRVPLPLGRLKRLLEHTRTQAGFWFWGRPRYTEIVCRWGGRVLIRLSKLKEIWKKNRFFSIFGFLNVFVPINIRCYDIDVTLHMQNRFPHKSDETRRSDCLLRNINISMSMQCIINYNFHVMLAAYVDIDSR